MTFYAFKVLKSKIRNLQKSTIQKIFLNTTQVLKDFFLEILSTTKNKQTKK